MLQPKVLPQLIQQANTNGVKTTLILSTEGSLLASTGDKTNDKIIAALVSSTWNTYVKAGMSNDDNKLEGLLLDTEIGKMAVESITNHVLLCLCGTDNSTRGLLRAKASELSSHLREPFEQLNIDEIY
mmetsp:Transcript_6934/g.10144  ORF Transcript_6934/g.10144 Transcript_6934/m.10144 type:complete len:128 (+) Transcript_6934:26-409(+)